MTFLRLLKNFLIFFKIKTNNWRLFFSNLKLMFCSFNLFLSWYFHLASLHPLNQNLLSYSVLFVYFWSLFFYMILSFIVVYIEPMALCFFVVFFFFFFFFLFLFWLQTNIILLFDFLEKVKIHTWKAFKSFVFLSW